MGRIRDALKRFLEDVRRIREALERLSPPPNSPVGKRFPLYEVKK